MTAMQAQIYLDGYLAGYRDGFRDAASGMALREMQGDLLSLPIGSMRLSARAMNCLCRSGCHTIADVAALSEYTILTMRNMGPKTATEVARWLHDQGIFSPGWQNYL